MIKGITETEYKIIKDILKDYNAQFYAYGSRVKGDFDALSDLDILVKSDDYEKIITSLKENFDKSRLPYVVSFADFYALDKNFYAKIKKNLTEII